jgi:hypothetical protein
LAELVFAELNIEDVLAVASAFGVPKIEGGAVKALEL